MTLTIVTVIVDGIRIEGGFHSNNYSGRSVVVLWGHLPMSLFNLLCFAALACPSLSDVFSRRLCLLFIDAYMRYTMLVQVVRPCLPVYAPCWRPLIQIVFLRPALEEQEQVIQALSRDVCLALVVIDFIHITQAYSEGVRVPRTHGPTCRMYSTARCHDSRMYSIVPAVLLVTPTRMAEDAQF